MVDVDEEGRGDLVVTTLSNEFMPLIRYRIGDLVELRSEACQTQYIVHGRAMDAIRGADGRRVTTWQVDQCFADLDGIAHYQLLEQPNGWHLRFLPDRSGPNAAAMANLRRLLSALRGTAEQTVTIEQTDLLMPESSGKFRLIYPASR